MDDGEGTDAVAVTVHIMMVMAEGMIRVMIGMAVPVLMSMAVTVVVLMIAMLMVVMVVPVVMVMVMVVAMMVVPVIALVTQPACHIGNLQGRIVEAVDEDLGRAGSIAVAIDQRRARIEFPEPRLQGHKPLGARHRLFGDHQPVGHRHLLDRFDMTIERRDTIHRIDDGNHAIKLKILRDDRIAHHRLHDRRRSASPVVSITTRRIGFVRPVWIPSIIVASVSMSSPRTVQQRQPFDSSISVSPEVSTRKLSIPTSPNSLMMTAVSLVPGSLRIGSTGSIYPHRESR